MGITQKTKIYSIVAILAAIVAMSILFLSWFRIHALGDTLLSNLQTIANYSSQRQAYDALSQTMQDTKAQRAELAGYILTDSNTIGFLTMIENSATSHSVVLTTTALNVTKGKGAFDTLDILMTLQGPTAQVLRLIQMFETLPYDAFLSQLTMTMQPISPTSPTATTQATLDLQVSLLKKI